MGDTSDFGAVFGKGLRNGYGVEPINFVNKCGLFFHNNRLNEFNYTFENKRGNKTIVDYIISDGHDHFKCVVRRHHTSKSDHNLLWCDFNITLSINLRSEVILQYIMLMHLRASRIVCIYVIASGMEWI